MPQKIILRGKEKDSGIIWTAIWLNEIKIWIKDKIAIRLHFLAWRSTFL